MTQVYLAMTQVYLKGWRTGFEKIKFNHLSHSNRGIPLSVARAMVNTILLDESVIIPFENPEAATRFLAAARRLGAVGQTEDRVRS